MKNILLDFFKGIAIGTGAIAPGVSGGALAVIFGIYEKITYAIGNILRDFKKNFLYLMPIGLGSVVGVLVFSNVFKYLFEHYNSEIRYLFIGLMVGTFPSLFKTANKKGFKKSYIIIFIIAFLITTLFSFMENGGIGSVSSSSPSIIQLIFYGIVVGVGTIIPGVSSSVILIYIGVYDMVLDAVASLNIPFLIPLGIGFVLCFLLLSKVISLLFLKAYGFTHYGILGFVVGSIIPIFPGFAFQIRYILDVLILIVSMFISYRLTKLAKN